jgi:hypothetical protein
VVVFAQLDEIQITQGAELLTTCAFHTRAAKHHFCSVCGVYTHHQRRLDPNQYAINAACLDGVSPFDFEEAPVIEGVNHPSDSDGKLHVIGTLRFVRSGET